MAEPSTPPLTFTVPTETELPPAYKLLTDSIAQQRATATRAILYSRPNITFPPLVAVAALLLHRYDPTTALILAAGVAIAVFSACGYLTHDYVDRAEASATKSGFEKTMLGRREVLVAKWGEEIIGMVVFERKKGRDALVYGWTVRLRYRGKGIGKALLEKVVEITDGKVAFAENHASMKFLPLSLFLSPFSPFRF
jgi:GNAT superfamily N-acetyltransferase